MIIKPSTNILVAVLLCVFASTASVSAQTLQPYLHEGPILLRDVTVIDGLGHLPYVHRDVLIEGGRIAKISITSTIGDVPDGVKIIEGEGMTVMPGIIDMHVHVWGMNWQNRHDQEIIQRTLNAFLYSGVTSVHDMGNEIEFIVKLRDDIASGDVIGPNISAVGDIINRLETVRRGVGDLLKPEVQAEITQRLDELQANDIEIVKLYTGLSSWSARHIMTEAKKRGMTGVADFWCTNLSLTGFQVTMVDGWAHGGCWEMQPYVAEWMRENDKFAILTLCIFDNFGGFRQFEEYETKAYLDNPLIVDVMGREILETYHDNFLQMRARSYDGKDAGYQRQLFGDMTHYLATNQANLRILHEAGVLIGMGTDTPSPAITWPGEGMHHELSLHVDAGVSPIDAIQMATFNGAKILGWEDRLGSVEEGKIADLVVVSGKPWEDISDTRNIVHVIKDGKLVNREALKVR